MTKSIAQRIFYKLKWVTENFDELNPEALSGDLKGLYKFRVGDYRVLYTIESSNPKSIWVHLIKHRREVYKIIPIQINNG